jgi:hypothetical protein
LRAEHAHIKPRSIHNAEVLEAYGGEYMYLSAIQFINEVRGTGARVTSATIAATCAAVVFSDASAAPSP